MLQTYRVLLRMVFISIALVVVWTAAASALELRVGGPATSGAAINRLPDLQALQNQQSRQIYQEQQRQFRDQDRQNLRIDRPNVDVPQMRSTCQGQGNGSRFSQTCR